jgi:hypothetical protein
LTAKKKSHAGRKPAGPFANNTSQLTIRMPDDLRAELKKSADKRGWSLSQELLWRVQSSYKRQREQERRPPATRALCFLISEIAERVGFFKISEWHRSAFAFRAFRLAVGQVFEALEPNTGMKNPYERLPEAFRQTGSPAMAEAIASTTKTPETNAAHIAKGLLSELLLRSNRSEAEAAWRDLRNNPDAEIRALSEHMLDILYGMDDARRDLGIQQP